MQDMETCGGMEEYFRSFLKSFLNEGKMLGPRPGRFIPGISPPGARRTGGCVDCGSGNEELVPAEISGLSSLVTRSTDLSWLHICLGSRFWT